MGRDAGERSEGPTAFGGGYALRVLGVGLLCFGLGAWPAWALAGPAGLAGLAVGVGVALLGSALGHLPLLFFRRGPDAVFFAALAGVGVRLLATLALALVAVFALPFPREAVAIGLVLAYLSLLAIEVRGLIVLGNRDVSRPRAGPQEEVDGP